MDVLGVVLVGGRSSRMGVDKATLSLGEGQGKLVDHVMKELRVAGCATAMVSGELAGYPCIADREPGLGPLGAIESVLTWLEALSTPTKKYGGFARVVFTPVDLPLVNSEVLSRLVSEEAAVAHFEEHVLPLVLRLETGTLEIVRSLLEAEDPAEHSIWALLERLGSEAQVSRLPVDEEVSYALTNTNTPGEWEHALRAVRKRSLFR